MITPAPLCTRLAGTLILSSLALGAALPPGLEDLARLTPGRTRAENALWIENPLTARFNTTNRVVVADLRGPAMITMLHFALPQSHVGEPLALLGRELVLRAYWDGETSPSVEVPLVEFFCDPAGTREEVNTALVNKRRGWNAYFAMPFRRSGRVELVYDGPLPPGDDLWRRMPCYSYVMYRSLKKVSADTGYFHANWRQESLLLGQRDYVALEARGRGKFVGWNVTLRLPGRDGYPVDMNEKFYVDGEAVPSVEFQGIEDSFGFSWGFPPTESQFPLTGFCRFQKGAMAYRFFLQDALSFRRSLRVTIGFGANEDPVFRREFAKSGNALQLSSTAYWYQTEPHAPQPALAPAAERVPAPEEAFWPEREAVPTADELRARKVKLLMLCGRSKGEVVFSEPGYAAKAVKGFTFEGWGLPVYHCRAGNDETVVQLTVPRGARGRVRVFVTDPDNFEGGRKQQVVIGGHELGVVEGFQAGRWFEQPLDSATTAEGQVTIRAVNARRGANAVLSMIEWVASGD
jgi:hypothetical protein